MKNLRKPPHSPLIPALAAAALTFAMTGAFDHAEAAEGGLIFTSLQVEQLEYRSSDDGNSLNLDVQGWIGNDDNKIWFKSEAEKPEDGKFEEAEIQLLYSRRISNYFDAQIGLRHDFEPSPERSHLVAGFQGLAPYWFEVDSSVFLSNKGEASARVEAEYDLLITQKLILQPSVEASVSAESVPERGIGKGLNDVQVGLRLRYEFVKQFAPYVGVHWERKLGQTARFAREEGEGDEQISVVAGLRFWF